MEMGATQNPNAERRYSSTRRFYISLAIVASLAILTALALPHHPWSHLKRFVTFASAAPPHYVTLTWIASTSKVVGYHVYRAVNTGGPYTLLNATPVPATTYIDSNVVAGKTYFYVVTAVDAKQTESVRTPEISAKVPTP
jgi:hypothetical protein